MGLLLQTRSCLANLPQCLTFYTYLFVGRVVCLSWFIFIVNLIQTEVIQKEEPHLREWFVGSKILRQKLVPGSGGLQDRLDCFSWIVVAFELCLRKATRCSELTRLSWGEMGVESKRK